MAGAREDILNTIRSATLGAARSRYAEIGREYRRAGELSRTERLKLFEDRLHDYGCAIFECPADGIREAVAHVMTVRAKHALLVPEGIDPQWLPEGLSFQSDGTGLSFRELDQSAGVLTGCALAIAETGTIVLRHSVEEGRRALTLLPDYHLCVVLEDQLVETVVGGFERMNEFSRAPLTTIAGPSATADIEMIRVQGVHGPRTLDVIVACSPLQ